jgi:hypothetical protein
MLRSAGERIVPSMSRSTPSSPAPASPSDWPLSSSARAGNRRFWLLSALRAHTKAPYKTDLLGKTLRAFSRPGRSRTVEAAFQEVGILPHVLALRLPAWWTQLVFIVLVLSLSTSGVGYWRTLFSSSLYIGERGFCLEEASQGPIVSVPPPIRLRPSQAASQLGWRCCLPH